MADLAEHEARAVRDYVNSQSPADDQATLVQRVHSKRILGRTHEVFDVHCQKTRWWVITDPTNLYLQTDFPESEQALIFHIGLGAVMAERDRGQLEDHEEAEVSGPWRRFRDALRLMDDASESEDYQAVGIKCRDALIALGMSFQEADWLPELTDPPQSANFKAWGDIAAEQLSEGRFRRYVKALVEKTWDITVSLQHTTNATPADADFVLDATAHLIGVFARLIRRAQDGDPPRCPRCDSYRLDEDIRQDPQSEGFWASTVCAACGWQTEEQFTSWRDHFDGTRLVEYLASSGTGISDRLHRDGQDPEPA